MQNLRRNITSNSVAKQAQIRKFSNLTQQNASKSERELADAVAKWTRPYTPGTLSRTELQQFWRDGYVIKHNVFSKDDLKPTIDSIQTLVDQVAHRLYKAGRIKDKCENFGFYQRLTQIEKQFPHASVLLHKMGILPKAISSLWSDKKLLDTAQQIIGPDIAGHPVWNLRTKVPQQEQATVPWHQDTAYLDPSCWSVLQLTAWIPLIDANMTNGCMQVVRGGHISGKTATHTCCVGNTWYVALEPEEMSKSLGVDVDKDTVTCEVPMGSVLFLNNLIPHRSLENYSDSIRWSLDLRWQDPKKANGFYGLKDNILMRSSTHPNHTIDWEQWSKINRQELQDKKMEQLSSEKRQLIDQVKREDGQDQHQDFDTTIAGPWMNQWSLVHHNRHTKALLTHGTQAINA